MFFALFCAITLGLAVSMAFLTLVIPFTLGLFRFCRRHKQDS